MSYKRGYPTYDEFLAQKGLPSQPPTPVIPILSEDYRQFCRITSLEDRKKHPQYDSYSRGEIYGYGTHPDGSYMYGPIHWNQWYTDWDEIGKDFEKPFRLDRLSFVEQIQDRGYAFDAPLFLGRDNRSDHQIWRVVKTFPIWSRTIGRIRPKKISFACKIASLRFYDFDWPLEQSVAALLKEAQILLQCRHPFIIRVYEYITLEDSSTNFPFVFVATIMELMDGQLMEFMERFNDGMMPADYCKIWCRQIAMAIDYLHNHITRVRVAHMAICPVNILFKVLNEQSMRYHFKLADFEECFVFDRNRGLPGQPVDLLSEDSEPPYWHRWCAPEVKRAAREVDYDLSTLRTFPNDIYSLGSTLAYALGGLNFCLQRRDNYINYCSNHEIDVNSVYHVIKITTPPDPLARVTAAQLMTHPWLFGVHQNIDLD